MQVDLWKSTGLRKLDRYVNGNVLSYFDENRMLGHTDCFTARIIVRTYEVYNKNTKETIKREAYFLNLRAFVNCLEHWNSITSEWIYYPTER